MPPPRTRTIGIFNRSYYEEVLVVRVYPEILRNQELPKALRDNKNIWKERYRSIVDLEGHLHRNGTQIVKIFLHLSKNEQRKRFLARIDQPERIENSASRIFTKENTGRITRKLMKSACTPRVPITRPGTTNRKTRGKCPPDRFPNRKSTLSMI